MREMNLIIPSRHLATFLLKTSADTSTKRPTPSATATTTATIILMDWNTHRDVLFSAMDYSPLLWGISFKNYHDWIFPHPETQPYDVRTPHFVEL